MLEGCLIGPSNHCNWEPKIMTVSWPPLLECVLCGVNSLVLIYKIVRLCAVGYCLTLVTWANCHPIRNEITILKGWRCIFILSGCMPCMTYLKWNLIRLSDCFKINPRNTRKVVSSCSIFSESTLPTYHFKMLHLLVQKVARCAMHNRR